MYYKNLGTQQQITNTWSRIENFLYWLVTQKECHPPFYLLSVSPYQVTTIIIHIAANVFQFGRVTEQAESPCSKFKESRSWNSGCEGFISKENKQRFQHRDHGLVSCFLFPILFWSIYFFEAQFQFWIKFKLLFLSCFVIIAKSFMVFISGKL